MQTYRLIRKSSALGHSETRKGCAARLGGAAVRWARAAVGGAAVPVVGNARPVCRAGASSRG